MSTRVARGSLVDGCAAGQRSYCRSRYGARFFSLRTSEVSTSWVKWALLDLLLCASRRHVLDVLDVLGGGKHRSRKEVGTRACFWCCDWLGCRVALEKL